MKERIVLVGIPEEIRRRIDRSFGADFEVEAVEFNREGRSRATQGVAAVVLGARQQDGEATSIELAKRIISTRTALVVVSQFNWDEASFQGGVFSRPRHVVYTLKGVLDRERLGV